MYNIENIINRCRENEFKTSDLEKISLAYKMLIENFKDDNNFINHHLNVAGIVCDLNVDATSIVASLLYGIKTEDIDSLILEYFGEEVLNIVNNLIKINNIKFTLYNDFSSKYLRKLLVGLSEDARVLLIKLADLLDIMRNAEILSNEEQKNIADMIMEVYVPIVHRLGINTIKSELENLCLKYLKPDMYLDIENKLKGTKEELSVSLEEMKESISDILTDHNIKFEIKSRVKSIYSIYHKLTTGHKWNEIYDILAMRLIVPTEEDCYLAIGLIHAKYPPVPKRFKDYIAMPKANMYQSLHTSVYGVNDNIYEVQVRTPEMDEHAERGVAAHWSYKENSKNVQNVMEQKLEIFRNTINMASEDEESFKKNVNDEILSTLIYVFTPKGDVMELPEGSTPIDFAYRIHSGVGDRTVGAIVNEEIVPLDYKLQNGDVIKINTLNSAKPNKDWLNFVKTTQAKNKIKAYFSKSYREEFISTGRDYLEKEVRKQKMSITETLSDKNIEKIVKDLKFKDEDELYLSIGSLRYTPAYVLSLIHEDKKNIADIMLERVNRNVTHEKKNYKNEIIVAGIDNVLVTIASCCKPVPGDEIIGFITKGEGVSVHRKDCFNVSLKNERLIDVSWSDVNNKLFNKSLVIKTNSMNNHLLEIVTAASTRNVSINSIKEVERNKMIDYLIEIKVSDKNVLDLFILELKKLSFVLEVM